MIAMNPFPQGGLPDLPKQAASRESVPPPTSPSQDSGGSAWLREMELAERQDWFQGALSYRAHPHATPSGASAAPAQSPLVKASSGAALAARIALDRLSAASAETWRAETWGGVPTVPVWADASDDKHAALHNAQTVQAPMGDARIAAMGPAGTTATTTGNHARASSGQRSIADVDGMGEATPLRLHLEFHAEGARLWIGTRTGTATEIEQAIAAVRHRLAREGRSLVSVTCNGKPWQADQAARTWGSGVTNQHNEG
ncbi:hypothetical protein ACKI2N_032260 [Cupriavidus sp. 30B13]|uniref:hypothetical protein n=1 Tax=Cupriavidus sp. 30B13 TaxID=3384241 RepID=UPI003B8FACD1